VIVRRRKASAQRDSNQQRRHQLPASIRRPSSADVPIKKATLVLSSSSAKRHRSSSKVVVKLRLARRLKPGRSGGEVLGAVVATADAVAAASSKAERSLACRPHAESGQARRSGCCSGVGPRIFSPSIACSAPEQPAGECLLPAVDAIEADGLKVVQGRSHTHALTIGRGAPLRILWEVGPALALSR